MASIVNRPQYPLGSRTGGVSTSVVKRLGVGIDWALGGIPFMGMGNDQWPYRQQSAQIRKEQIDTSAQPGEQALDGWWWLRYQTAWEGGAGSAVMEPTNDEMLQRRFWDSWGIDVWTDGELSLLPSTTQRLSSVNTDMCMAGVKDGVVVSDGAVLKKITDSTVSTLLTAASKILSVTTDGLRVWAICDTELWIVNADGTGATKLLTFTSEPNVVLGWEKHRLVVCIGAKVYELATGTETVLPTEIYTHPTPGWKFTSIASAPQAVMLSGYAGNKGAILRMGLSADDGSLPTLSAGVDTAKLPTGEVPNWIDTYLGSYLMIGTSKGVRVGQVDDDGRASYGPLIVESTHPVGQIASFDRFVWAGVGKTGTDAHLTRIDLSEQVAEGRWAYAADVSAGVSGNVSAARMFAETSRVAFAVDGHGVYISDADDKTETGWINMSMIRFNTTIDKVWHSIVVDCDTTGGTITVGSRTAVNGAPRTETVLDTSGPQLATVRLGWQPANFPLLGAYFVLTRPSAQADVTPKLYSYQVRAYPKPEIQTVYQIPVLCLGSERDRHGAVWHPGVKARLDALEQLMADGNPVLLQRFADTGWAREVVIDRWELQRPEAPIGTSTDGEPGGVLVLTCRTV